MKTAQEITDFVYDLLKDDCNVLAITLQNDVTIHTFEGTTETAPKAIEIFFEDDSCWYEALTIALKEFLEEQPFEIISDSQDSLDRLLVLLP